MKIEKLGMCDNCNQRLITRRAKKSSDYKIFIICPKCKRTYVMIPKIRKQR